MSKSSVAPRRLRRTAEDARRTILAAAEARFAAGGPDAVRVQTVAADLNVTDAAVHYHFGSREGLLEAVVKSAGRRMRDDLERVVAGWTSDTLDITGLVKALRKTLESEGHARSTAWLALRGWTPQGAGMLRPLAETIHQRRCDLAAAAGTAPPPFEDSQFIVRLLATAMWGHALTGDAWARSVGLTAGQPARDRFVRDLVELVNEHLAPSSPGGDQRGSSRKGSRRS
jgi:AcrR family transcriptional regulator